MSVAGGNLLGGWPRELPGELVEVLCSLGPVRIERIVSRGHASPPGFWYDQATDEWVALLQGRARIRLEGEEEPVIMGPGDYLHLPAHCRHRVEETAPDETTVWLAIHVTTQAG